MEITASHLAWGKVAYNGYIKQTGGVSLVSGDKLPPFEKLKREIQDAWAASVIAIKLNQDMVDRGMWPEPTLDEG
jgi:hypothetical protein